MPSAFLAKITQPTTHFPAGSVVLVTGFSGDFKASVRDRYDKSKRELVFRTHLSEPILVQVKWSFRSPCLSRMIDGGEAVIVKSFDLKDGKLEVEIVETGETLLVVKDNLEEIDYYRVFEKATPMAV